MSAASSIRCWHVRRWGVALAVAAAAAVSVGCDVPEREERLERLHLPSEPVAADPGRGAEFFRMHCAVCHGPAARGTEQGPPLVHDLYRPGRHADLAFHRAVSTGTKQHHWKFGDMPAMPQIEPAAVEHIIAFIRREQRRAGVIE